MIDRCTAVIARCAVIGNPIAQSKSPELHAGFARERGLALDYGRILGDEANFEAQVLDFFKNGGHGMNVTAPFKERAFRLCQRLSDEARQAGAVNTLMLQNGELWGHNTDGLGLCAALAELAIPITGQRLAIIGAGGAVRGIGPALLAQRPQSLTIANRSPERAAALLALFEPLNSGTRLTSCALADLSGHFDLIINGASAGLTGEALELNPGLSATVGYDLSYGKETAFLAWARTHCQRRYDGYSMLVGQGRLSFNCWFPEN